MGGKEGRCEPSLLLVQRSQLQSLSSHHKWETETGMAATPCPPQLLPSQPSPASALPTIDIPVRELVERLEALFPEMRTVYAELGRVKGDNQRLEAEVRRLQEKEKELAALREWLAKPPGASAR